MRCLIINADGYGFTEGTTRAIQECIEFGTVRSISANVNFPYVRGLRDLVKRYPFLSVGCHLNPIVGRPLLPVGEVRSLVDRDGNFLYKNFAAKFRRREIDIGELRAELMAQIERTRDLAGDCFSHVDFHMGLHRLPRLYPLFLEAAAASGTGRIRTHRYFVGIENRYPRLRHAAYMLGSLRRLSGSLWNFSLRKWARLQGFAMPDYGLVITHMTTDAEVLSLDNYFKMVTNIPEGYSEFVAHPAYVDAELRRWSVYIDGRVQEHKVLLDPRFREALERGPTQLAGYRDIPLRRMKGLPTSVESQRRAAPAPRGVGEQE